MNRTIMSVVGILGVAILAYIVWGVTPQTVPEDNIPKYTSYKSSEYGPEFAYPIAWGDVTLEEGNKVCPEEDTYFTQDTLQIYDWEYSFSEMKLPESESFIRTGVRTYELDPEKLDKCGGEFHQSVASKKLNPAILSSVRLVPIVNQSGLGGVFNEEASRLNTASRMQYTYYYRAESWDTTYVLQPYMVFIPHFGSPELKELEEDFDGDMAKYLQKGQTAEKINEYFKDFKILAEGMKFNGE